MIRSSGRGSDLDDADGSSRKNGVDRYITFNLIVVRAHCFSLAAGARKNRMWADSALFFRRRAVSDSFIRRGLPPLISFRLSLVRAFSRSDPLAAGASVARALDRSLLVSDVLTMFDRYIS